MKIGSIVSTTHLAIHHTIDINLRPLAIMSFRNFIQIALTLWIGDSIYRVWIDPKSIDVETFIQKIEDHGQAENMNKHELLNNFQQFSRGPAYARQSIFSWNDFTHKLRS